MTTTCSLPHKVETRDVAAPALPVSSIPDCAGALEITTWLHEHEKAGHGFDSWPADVQTRVRSIITEWMQRNAGCPVLAVTTAVVPARGSGRNAVTLLHHGPKPKG